MTTKRVAGSWRDQIVATELLEERARCNFDQNELYMHIFKDPKARFIMEKAFKD